MSQEPTARTTTKSGIIYQRTQQGWFETVGVWSVLFVAVFILLTFALPPEPPYLDVAVIGFLLAVVGWRLLLGTRQMLTAIGENHLQYIGQGRAWYFYFKDLSAVDLESPAALFSISALFGRRSAVRLPRRAVFYMTNGNRVHIRLTFFDGPALLMDLDARLPKRVTRSERFTKTLQALRAEAPPEAPSG